MRFPARLLCLAILCPTLTANVSAAVSDDEIRIGFITDFRGIYADLTGQGSLAAAEMAIEDAGGTAAGHAIELIVGGDARLDPERGLELARQLYREHRVDMITGVVGSDVALAIQAFATEHGIAILHSGPATNELTGSACSPIGIQWAFNNYALASATVSSTFSEKNDRWFFITADYAWGHDIFESARKLIEKAGGEVVGNALSPYQSATFVGELSQAMNAEADVVALANAGEDLQRTVRQGYELGMNRSGKTVVALDVYITDIRRLGLYVTSGLTFPTSFYWNIGADRRAWSERFRERTGSMPTMPQAGVYSAISHYLRAVDATGSDDARTVVDRMRELPIDDFFVQDGHIRADGQMVHDMFLMQVKGPLESSGAWDYLEVVRKIPGEEAFGPLAASDCPLVGQ